MEISQGIENLRAFVLLMVSAGVIDKDSYKVWSQENLKEMEKLFGYASEGKMPKINSLISPFFHPKLPLIGLNYTPVAHNTLHEHPKGWTDSLRLCRGIIFDHVGTLVALPFPKFFNYGEMPETKNLPEESFVATVKHDGHLGIIFWYDGNLVLTTRGSFVSRSSDLGCQMLAEIARANNWEKHYGKHLTLLVEIIHPETRVYTDYNFEGFVVIGGSNRFRQIDYNHSQLKRIANDLNLPLTEKWVGRSIGDLIKLMQDRSIQNQEGFVVRFASGLRVKFKFETYIGLMVQDKLSYTYLMNRIISGNLERMLLTLPEEIYTTALQMLGEIMLKISLPGTLQEKWKNLYSLAEEDKSTSYFQGVCRKFTRHILQSQ